MLQTAPELSSPSRHTEWLYPTFAHLSPDGKKWCVSVRGITTLPGTVEDYGQRMFVRLLKRFMNAAPEDVAGDIFRWRVHPFLVAGRWGHKISIRVGDRSFPLKKRSRMDGHFSGQLEVDVDELSHLTCGPDDRGWLSISADTANPDAPSLEGQIQLLPDTGVSVISDIDDTVRDSNVADRRELLFNTFVREFRAVGGIADMYRQWAAQGASFHYVSSSPWQLYAPLAELFRREGVPSGSFHLRLVHLHGPSIVRLFMSNRWGKWMIIRSIIKTFPHRRFVLVGDSGERDAEIYSSLGRKYAGHIARIFIRNTGSDGSAARVETALRAIPKAKWQLFDDASEIADQLPRW